MFNLHVFLCMHAYVYACLHVYQGLWKPKADTTYPLWSLFHIILGGKVSDSNPDLTNMISVFSPPAPGWISCLYLPRLKARITGEVPHPPSMSFPAFWDLQFGLLPCVLSAVVLALVSLASLLLYSIESNSMAGQTWGVLILGIPVVIPSFKEFLGWLKSWHLCTTESHFLQFHSLLLQRDVCAPCAVLGDGSDMQPCCC